MKRPESLPERCRLAAAALTLVVATPLYAGNAALPPMIDAHSHYTADDARILPPEDVPAILDAAGVRRLAVTAAPPELAQKLYAHAPGRVIPLLGVYGEGVDKANWLQDADLPEKAAARLATGRWAGIGELHLFAADANNPVYAELVRLAERHKLVLLIHGDAEVVNRTFELAPGVRVLWAHLGTAPRPDILARMLARHPQLWIDTSVRDERIAPDGRLLPEWRALFLRHPDRFLVAVDAFSSNRWRHYGEVAGQIRAWVEPLPAELKRKLLHDNAARLFAEFWDG